MEMVDIIKDCGVPPGAVNLLSGDPAEITTQLLSSDIVKKFQSQVPHELEKLF